MRGTSLPYTSDFTELVSRGGMPLDEETVGLQGRKSKRNDEVNDGMRRWKGQGDSPAAIGTARPADTPTRCCGSPASNGCYCPA
jgi:hypothetical protein